MNIIKKALGKGLYPITKIIEGGFTVTIRLLETLVLITKGISGGLLLLLSMGGCLFLIIFAIPLGFRVLTDPYALGGLLFLFFFPMLAGRLLNYLKKQRFLLTGFLYNLSKHLIRPEEHPYRSYASYKKAYEKAQEDYRREQERRFYEQQRQKQRAWNEQFHQWQSQGASGRRYYYHSGSNGQWSNRGGHHHTFGGTGENPRQKYRESLDILGVSEDADERELKSAYRKKAKKYHPDINKDPDATKKFQKINDAYKFLSEYS